MYIIFIACLYVVILMAATEKSVAAGLLTFTFYGLIPCGLLLWILGAKHRRHYRNKQLLEQDVREPDSGDTQADQ